METRPCGSKISRCTAALHAKTPLASDFQIVLLASSRLFCSLPPQNLERVKRGFGFTLASLCSFVILETEMACGHLQLP
ncbi:hypothetical protein QVD17_34583 [Tagetes erecta]|uniref:Uncharacterized protein n=1 Tax=Tagetes erecta TaxID=13708 RepID=A0AAD8NEK3_TARER|nr:hypothetical protein QVD17_34583 [Tagetes erecta]